MSVRTRQTRRCECEDGFSHPRPPPSDDNLIVYWRGAGFSIFLAGINRSLAGLPGLPRLGKPAWASGA